MSNLAYEVTRALGGEWHGSYGAAPGPGHKKTDRSLTIRPHRDNPDDVFFHSFAGDDCRPIRDDLRRRGILPTRDFHRPVVLNPVARKKMKAEARERERQDAAEKERKRRWVNSRWQKREPAEGTVVEGYMEHERRLKNPPLDALGYLPARLAGQPYPAMIAGFGLPVEYEPGRLRLDEVQGVPLTFLDGIKKAPIAQKKIMHGSCKGMPIVLAPPNDGLAICIAEGIESALSIHAVTGMGAWAAGSAGFMPELAHVVPDWIECVTIWAEKDKAGQDGAQKLYQRLLERGFEVRVAGVVTWVL